MSGTSSAPASSARWGTLASCFFVACLACTQPLLAAAQATEFDVALSLSESDGFQFAMNNGWSILFSLENVYYDENRDSTPKQAFRVTDVNGDPLEPFAIPVQDPENYILDMSFLTTGQGLRPYFRTDELTNASLRAWRIDYYKNGVGNSIYTTVMSGVAVPIGDREFMLRVDLGLHWEIEGDAINRLQQGMNSHIALAINDFQSFTLVINANDDGGTLAADVRTTTAAVTTTTAQDTTTVAGETTTPNNTPVASTTNTADTTDAYSEGTAGSSTEEATATTTTEPYGSTAPGPSYAPTGPPPPPLHTTTGVYREASTTSSEEPANRESNLDCNHLIDVGKGGKKGKGKKSKKGDAYHNCLNGRMAAKGGKKGGKIGAMSAGQRVAAHGGVGVTVSILFVFMGAAMLIATRKTLETVWETRKLAALDHEMDEFAAQSPPGSPARPIPIRAFGTFSTLTTEQLDAAIASMRNPDAIGGPPSPTRTQTSQSVLRFDTKKSKPRRQLPMIPTSPNPEAAPLGMDVGSSSYVNEVML
jgi:hypothetical protein